MVMMRATPNLKPFENLRKRAQAAPTLMKNASKIAVRRERPRFLKALQRAVNLPTHPFIWSRNKAAQARARRWWFRAVRTGQVPTEGGRYRRTGELVKAWKLVTEYSADGVTIKATNSRPGARFVVGDRQVPSHIRSGHPQIAVEAEKSASRLTVEIVELWQTISDPAQPLPK